MNRKRILLTLGLSLMLGSAAIILLLWQPGGRRDFPEEIRLFNTALDLIKKEYIYPRNPAQTTAPAFSRLLLAVDRAAAYLDRKQADSYFALQGEKKIYSTGIFGKLEDNRFQISRVIPGSSADRVGIRAGDEIYQLENTDLKFLSHWQVMTHLHCSSPGKIRVALPPGINEENPRIFDLSVTPLSSDTGCGWLSEDVYYFPLPRFNEAACRQLRAIIDRNPPRHLILDLREYLGGEFDIFIKISRLLLSPQIRLTLTTRYQSRALSLGGNPGHSVSPVGIIDRSTVMYGELLAWLLDAGGHLTVGEKSGGILAALTPLPFRDGSLALVPNGYFSLNGKRISGNPVIPRILKEQLILPEQGKELLSVLCP